MFVLTFRKKLEAPLQSIRTKKNERVLLKIKILFTYMYEYKLSQFKNIYIGHEVEGSLRAILFVHCT